MNDNTTAPPPVMQPPLHEAVQRACRRIPPLWSLRNFVAVNPFVGLTDRHFIEAARLIQRVGHGELLRPANSYRRDLAAGRVTGADLATAVAAAVRDLPPGWSRHVSFPTLADLDRQLAAAEKPAADDRLLTLAEFIDHHLTGGRAAFVVDEISKWCSVYFDEGQSSWRMPWRGLGLFDAWQSAARRDANPEWAGWPGFRSFVASLPNNPLEVIGLALERLGVPEPLHEDFLHRQLMSLAGWSGYVQCRVRGQSMHGVADDSLCQFLAIRLAYDLALWGQFEGSPWLTREWLPRQAPPRRSGESFAPELLARYVAQSAMEAAYQRQLASALRSSALRSPALSPVAGGRKALQAVFCIDVRSEIIRRALEACAENIQTIGFAGFFGMPVEYVPLGKASGAAQCPVLLKPRFKVREPVPAGVAEPRALTRLAIHEQVNSAWNAFKTSAISCFSFVETAGLAFGIKLARQAFLTGVSRESGGAAGTSPLAPVIDRERCCGGGHGDHPMETGIPLDDQVALAAGALKHMGLVSGFARIVLICGHGSETVNNPYGSALDCGACGGHAGDVNARVAAGILNRKEVRAALGDHGIRIPDDTVFIAGLHNTTTDEIRLYQDDPVIPPGHAGDLETVRQWLHTASRQARRERAAALGLSGTADPDARIIARSGDWSQVRPEWGLAGNAAFIAAPRERTRGMDLSGRVFLHDYHAAQDADLATLELILSAPVVVASWISLQYYGSTVDNRLFGSGNKVIHNLVGTFGVWQGNGGDLQTGLPMQSLHDGLRWMHEPLRLSVYIEATRENLLAVLDKQPGVRELFGHGWLHLLAIDPADGRIHRYTGGTFESESA